MPLPPLHITRQWQKKLETYIVQLINIFSVQRWKNKQL